MILRSLAVWLLLCAVAFAQPATIPAWPPTQVVASGSGMVTPVASGMANQTTNSVQLWGSLIQGQPWGNWSTTNNNVRENIMPVAGTFSAMSANFPVAISGGTTYTLFLTKNGTTTALGCTITSAALTCNDVADTVSVVAGDTVGWTVTPTGTPTNNNFIQMSVLFTSTLPNQSFIVGSNANNITNGQGTSFVGASNTCSLANEVNCELVMPTNGTIDTLQIQVNTAPGGTNTVVWTVYHNGSASGLTCTMTGASKLCGASSGSVTIAAGDTISLQAATGVGSPTFPNITSYSVRWVPTIAGEAIWGSVGSNGIGNFNRTSGSSGGSGGSGETPNSQVLSPANLTLKKFYLQANPVPGGVTARTVTLRHGNGSQSNSTVTCILTSALTTCSDLVDTYSSALGDFTNFQTVNTGSPASLTSWTTGLVATVP